MTVRCIKKKKRQFEDPLKVELVAVCVVHEEQKNAYILEGDSATYPYGYRSTWLETSLRR